MSRFGMNRRAAMKTIGATGLGVLGVAAMAHGQRPAKLEKLETAIAAMREAKTFMEKGAGFGGHKKKSIEALTHAISELEAAIEFAKNKKG